MSEIQVREKTTGEILFRCSSEQSDKAYEEASRLEQLGIDVEVVAPTVHEDLAQALGTPQKEWENYQKELIEEIESHDSGCSSCITGHEALEKSIKTEVLN